jgi:hypothetical protein
MLGLTGILKLEFRISYALFTLAMVAAMEQHVF